MINNAQSNDTIVLGGATDDTITLTGWDSPLSSSLSTDYSYSATLGTPTSITSGGSGATLTTTTGGGLMWGNVGTPYITGSPGTITTSGNWTTPAMQGQLKVSGDAVFDGEVTIRGVKLDDRLTAIEERLGILRPNNDLEGKWEKLKALGDEYRKLEQEILEGENIWDILKK
jgi:hypothetical protein